MRRLSSALAMVALLAVVAPELRAQFLVGRVVDRTTNEAIGGVVVSGVDSTGSIVFARAVTDRANGYRLPLVAGMVRVQFRRIGYAPLKVALADSANGRIDVTMTRLPTQLPPVTAVMSALCDARPDREEALALWEEARSGLLTSIVARESKLAWISVLAYTHGYDGEQELPRRVQRIELASAANAFVSGGDPATLARNGYLERDGRSVAFLGPDDIVLFDETFFSTHCFSLEKPLAGNDSIIGLHFAPGKGRRVPEIEGTVWLRKDPLDLKSVEFKYVNIDRASQRANPGGAFGFLPMPNGITMINEWRIRGAFSNLPRMPVRRGGSSRSARAARDPMTTTTETGALIELMQWPDAAPYLAKLGSVTGVAREKRSGRVLRNTQVRFDGTPFAVVTDSAGGFRIMDVLPGIYALDIGDPMLDLHGIAPPLPLPRRIVAGPNDLGDVEIEDAADLVKRACSDKDFEGRVLLPPGLGSAAVFGMIVDENGRVVNRPFRVEVRPASLVAGSPPMVVKGRPDALGRFRVCGVPIDGTVTIVTDESRSMVGRAELVFNNVDAMITPYQLTTVQLKPKPAPPPP